MSFECVTCGKISEKSKDFFEVSGFSGCRCICRDCATELGIKNFMSAGFHSNTAILKKYVLLHPEAQSRLDAHLKIVNADRKEVKIGFAKLMSNIYKKLTYKKYSQTKYRCCSCDHIYYCNISDHIKNFYNFTHATVYSWNQMTDPDRCPKCGSKAIIKKEVYYWLDDKGNCVDMQE